MPPMALASPTDEPSKGRQPAWRLRTLSSTPVRAVWLGLVSNGSCPFDK